jgi:hypothetical protein
MPQELAPMKGRKNALGLKHNDELGRWNGLEWGPNPIRWG